MTVLGLGAGGRPSTDVRVGFRSGLFRHISVAIGGAGGMAVALGGFELLRTQPKEGFALLSSWGPAFLLGALALAILGSFLSGMNATVRESFHVVAESVRTSAGAQARQADALTRLADQGGRQAEEVRRLAIYAGREFPSIYERFDRQDQVLEKLAAAVQGIHARLNERRADPDEWGMTRGIHAQVNEKK